MNHLSLEAREHYAALYDFAGLIDDQLGQEEEIWRSLNAFNYVSHLSADDRRKIRDLTSIEVRRRSRDGKLSLVRP